MFFYIIMYNCKVTIAKFFKKCSEVKVQYLDPRCSGVEVKVLEIGNTQLKYR